jgi:hypothetical protein
MEKNSIVKSPIRTSRRRENRVRRASPRLDLWKDQVKQWPHLGPPLRPAAEDVAFMHAAATQWLRQAGRNSATLLVLGVTPELCKLQAGAVRRVVAVDRSVEMIRSVWPGRIRPQDAGFCADWASVPLPDASVDLALGDGCFTAVPYPSGYSEVCAELRRLLRRASRCLFRCFVQAQRKETIHDVFADLAAGRIGNFHILKWRVAMALQENSISGVALRDVWHVLHESWPDLDQWAERYSWPMAAVRTLETYRDVDSRYHFPTLEECREFFEAEGFAVIDLNIPSYELRERCPTFVLELARGERAAASTSNSSR